MKTIIHIGMPKTGSTALQACFAKSRQELASHGVLYPTNVEGCPFKNHRLLVGSFLKFGSMPRHIQSREEYTRENIDAKYREFVDHVHEQIAGETPEAMVLSSESLFRRIPPHKYRPVRRMFDRFGNETQFVAYLRRPSEYFLSMLQQNFRASHEVKQPLGPQFRAVLRSYLECFGVPVVSAELFHRDSLADRDVVSDFCARYLREYGVRARKLRVPEHANESVGGESMDILARYRLTFHAERNNVASRDTMELFRELTRADRKLGAGRPRLRPGIADLVDQSRDDPLWVRDRFGVEFPDFDYARLEKSGAKRPEQKQWRLEDLVEIDRDMQKDILAEIGRSDWAKMDAARVEWVNAAMKGALADAL